MSYTPTNWQAGDKVTATKLNNMESGINVAVNPFIVTLTPTAENFSGTMDKTVAEINTAYEAGRKIVFRVMQSATAYMDVDCTARWFNGSTYPSFNGFIVNSDNNVLIFAFTGATSDGTRNTYGTTIYPLQIDEASGVSF